ncbi:hypothetical protein BH11MYX1_BH11MYX1_07640 [soil metagenome]
MKTCLALFLIGSLAASARADTIGGNPADHGTVTGIRRGAKELDVGGMFVINQARGADGQSNMSVSSLGSFGLQYFVRENISVGGSFVATYDRQGSAAHATAFGGMVFASLHLRLGLGAFLRPTLGGGVLTGHQTSEVTASTVMQASETSALLRIGLPFAYFASSRLVLQAGPELDISIGQVTPEGQASASFSSMTGGFGVSAGYAF